MQRGKNTAAHSGESAKLELGERYVQIWVPVSGHVLFP